MKVTKRKIIIGCAILAAVALAVWLFRPRAQAAQSVVPEETASVMRGDLDISIQTTGQFQCENSVSVIPQGKWSGATISFLVEEGALVKKEEVICRLDNPRVASRRRDLEVQIPTDRASFQRAIENEKIAQSSAEQSINAASLALDMARLAREQYGIISLTADGLLDDAAYEAGSVAKGDAYQTARDLSLAITRAETDLKLAETDFSGMDGLLAKGFVTKTEYDESELKVLEAKRSFESAHLAFRIFRDYTYPSQVASLEAGVSKAKNDLGVKKLQAESDVSSAAIRVRNARTRLAKREEQLKEAIDEDAYLAITAPIDGRVVYGNPDSHRGQSSNVAVGQPYWPGQELFTIPDTSSFIVKTRVLEMDVLKVKPGQEAAITSQALQGAKFRATVTKVSETTSQGGGGFMGVDKWKYYDVYLKVEDVDARIKAGMSCDAQIILQSLWDVTYVPVVAVFNTGGRRVVYVTGAGGKREVPVETGQSSEKFVVITQGVEAGTRVVVATGAPTMAGRGASAERGGGAGGGPR